MADEKPKSPAPAPAPERDTFREGVEILVVFFVLATIWTSISNFITHDPLSRNGFSGLTTRGILLSYTRPIASLANPIGAHIIATDEPTAVEDDAGGLVIGYQKFGNTGTIIRGPVEVGGVKYYDVDFTQNPDGWVAENRIAYQEGKPSLVARIILGFWKLITYGSYTLWIISLIIFVFLARTIRRLTALRVNNRAKLYPELMVDETKSAINPKWQRVVNHVESLNENDWRLAIIEADIMLSELLATMSLGGDSIGEKLKGVEKSDFITLDSAWEAHKIRNQIAHAGSDFGLTQREARRVVGLYEAVFTEFQFI